MLKGLKLLSLLLLSANSYAENFKTYFGAEAQVRHMQFERDHGGNIFKKHFPQANIFLGTKLNEYVGVELGYETSINTARRVNLSPGKYEMGGDPTARNNFQVNHGKAKISGPNINILGYIKFQSLPNFELFQSIGISRLRVKLISLPIACRAGLGGPELKRSFLSEKFIVRAGGGAQFTVEENFKIRGSLMWENTDKFKRVKPKETKSPRVFGTVKDSIIFGLGASYLF